jgi:N6-L-threonylcarbamoyladenine synthase
MSLTVLALETSCDETSAAVVRRDGERCTLEGLAILSQDIHRIFGGVVPELASRAHLETVGPVCDEALKQADCTLEAIDGIAVTHGPGLLGALLVGVTWAKTLAWREGLPLIGVHHLEGHLFAPVLEDPTVQPPFTALLVSGGHTMLLDVPTWGDYRLLGATKDDAAGEAFDKVGTLLGLDYPAGAAMERLAAKGDPGRYTFPRPLLRGIAEEDRWNFSFSGLKTALLRAVQKCEDVDAQRAHLARGFQDAAIEVLIRKTADAALEYQRDLVVLGGGVACNRALTVAMREQMPAGTRVAVASPRLNTDNAAMIGAAGSWRLAAGERHDSTLEARDSLPLPGLAHPTGAVP